MSKELFSAFNAVDLARFKEQLTKDLRGEPISSLSYELEPELTINAYHHRDENRETGNVAIPYKSDLSWINRKTYSCETANKKILEDLNNGISGIGLTSKNFSTQTKDVLFEYIHCDVEIDKNDFAKSSDIPTNVHTIYDVITDAFKAGTKVNLDDFKTYAANFLQHPYITINGEIYADAGASSSQELAYILGHLAEYFNTLDEGNAEADLSKTTVNIGITENYFVNIAKFRALRILLNAFAKAYNIHHFKGSIHGVASTRNLTVNDAHNNLLRSTTQAMSAVIGGADILTLKEAPGLDAKKTGTHERMMKNISLVLAEESFLQKVSDAGAGAFYIEDLTQQLVKNGWDLFLELENKGGLIAAYESGNLQAAINQNRIRMIEAVQKNKLVVLGVNKYQNNMEEYANIPAGTAKLEKAILPLNLESFFTPEMA